MKNHRNTWLKKIRSDDLNDKIVGFRNIIKERIYIINHLFYYSDEGVSGWSHVGFDVRGDLNGLHWYGPHIHLHNSKFNRHTLSELIEFAKVGKLPLPHAHIPFEGGI